MRQATLGIGLPDVNWSPPTQLPDRLHGEIGLDLETRDNGLSQGAGPGWAWDGGGYVVGVSIHADNFSGYLPMRHEGGGNLDPGLIRRWLAGVLADPKQPKVGANLLYDLGWLKREGIEVAGPLHDVLWAEALLDEHRTSYSLDTVARDRIQHRKDEKILREAARALGFDPKSEMWRLPARFVGIYAEADALLPKQIRAVQRPLIEKEGLGRVYDLEHALIPLYLDMRWRGVRFDEARAEPLAERMEKEQHQIIQRIRKITGVRINPWNASDVARALAHENIVCPQTAKTKQPSVTAAFLKKLEGSEIAALVQKVRQLDKLASTFLRQNLLGNCRNGRIHAEFHPLRSDDGGTVGGRGSMSRPNLQQVPARSELGKEIRRCFLPEEGEQWGCADYSQQEPRLLVHWAAVVGDVRGRPIRGVPEALAAYKENPDLSYHQMVVEMTRLAYNHAKALNLAIVYGRGPDSVAQELGITGTEARRLFDQHAEALPFASEMAEIASRRAKKAGVVKTLLGRRCRFPLWEPAGRFGKGNLAYPLEEAEKKWPGKRLVRAWTYRALNRIIQGSAADQTKEAMLKVYQAGYGSHILLQVHDELDSSIPEPKIGHEIAAIMRDAVPLRIPSKVDCEIGPTWGDAK